LRIAFIYFEQTMWIIKYTKAKNMLDLNDNIQIYQASNGATCPTRYMLS